MTTPVRKYRRRSTVTRAVEFTGTEHSVAAIHRAFGTEGIEASGTYLVLTTEGGAKVTALPGDWIVPEPSPGRFYPVGPAVFAATYEPVDR